MLSSFVVITGGRGMSRIWSIAAAGCLALAACSSEPTDAVITIPEQGPLLEVPAPVGGGGRVKALATFSSQAVVLSRRNYAKHPDSDPLSEFSPTDLAVAWGLAGRAAARRGIKVTQWSRRYVWRGTSRDVTEAMANVFRVSTANWHILPANEEVREQLEKVAVGNVISLDGDLVQVSFPTGFTARSSLIRDDEGDGACEIIWVRALRILRVVPR